MDSADILPLLSVFFSRRMLLLLDRCLPRGGETARAILEGWGVRSLHMLGELEPGLPFSYGLIHNRTLPVLTKAGAFGNQDTLVSCWRFFANLPRTLDTDSTRNSL